MAFGIYPGKSSWNPLYFDLLNSIHGISIFCIPRHSSRFQCGKRKILKFSVNILSLQVDMATVTTAFYFSLPASKGNSSEFFRKNLHLLVQIIRKYLLAESMSADALQCRVYMVQHWEIRLKYHARTSKVFVS